ncbi:uncharacterized protein LOC111244384 [Varroa destructor]|uniref:Uncharacterized protein n=2 Tax=Varroa TaxID=62624 RepID=A0A7M7M429_VARDE|nr:uncharacterized protein LOC111244384 [Varroa destructor]
MEQTTRQPAVDERLLTTPMLSCLDFLFFLIAEVFHSTVVTLKTVRLRLRTAIFVALSLSRSLSRGAFCSLIHRHTYLVTSHGSANTAVDQHVGNRPCTHSHVQPALGVALAAQPRGKGPVPRTKPGYDVCCGGKLSTVDQNEEGATSEEAGQPTRFEQYDNT